MEVIKLGLHLLSLLFLLRLLLQWVQADFFNPLSQTIFKLTGPVVEPLHRIFPTLGTLNTAALMAAILIKWLFAWILVVQGGLGLYELPKSFIVAIFEVIAGLIEIYFWGIIIVALASWLDALKHPHIVLVGQIIEPYLQPFRRIIPPIGIIDISSMIALIGLMILRDRILPMAENFLQHLLF